MLTRLQKKFGKLLTILFVGNFVTGCGTTRAVFIHDGDLIRIGPNVKGRVYVLKGGEWVLTKPTTLPEGWYAGAVKTEEKPNE
ncbi:MAG: hypothetical protein CMI54_09030 [Parcubacteria group bacterium]|jgi:hypothetical protein|nr:hypothetical protein [Parcubacteria group bacterium]|tara:strand:- start:4270 stop:4518 length:249 start_codon:yes stop_codon:yes gene_type:complete